MSGDKIIIVRRKRRRKGNGHGCSAWKIAFADFSLSMMAVFLVMWVSTATLAEQAVIGQYFSGPNSVLTKGGHPSMID